jgi:hypothetical protein
LRRSINLLDAFPAARQDRKSGLRTVFKQYGGCPDARQGRNDRGIWPGNMLLLMHLWP